MENNTKISINHIKSNNDNITKEMIIEKLELFDTRIYDEIFERKIKIRGQEYAYDGKVENIRKENVIYYCNVQGTSQYDVSIQFENENSNKLKNINCTCKYFCESKCNCKHIYALLYKLKCAGNMGKILNEIIGWKNKMINMLHEYKCSIEEEEEKYSEKQFESYNKFVTVYANMVCELVKNSRQSKNEEELMRLLSETIGICLKLMEYCNRFMNGDVMEIDCDKLEENGNANSTENLDNAEDDEIDEYIVDEWFEDDDGSEFDDDFDEFDNFDVEDKSRRENRDFASRFGKFVMYKDAIEVGRDKELDGFEKVWLWKYLDKKE